MLWLGGGIVAGGTALGLLALAIRSLVRSVVSAEPAPEAVVVLVVVLVASDVYAIWRNRLNPLGARRQAFKRLEYVFRRSSAVAAVWGVDAGFSLGTYRVTSGVWVGLVAVLLGVAPWWVIVAYTTAFAVALVGLALLPARRTVVGTGSAGGTEHDPFDRRIRTLARHRRHVQVAYVLAVAVVLLGWASA